MRYLELTKEKDYSVVKMNRGKVNALNHDMVLELSDVFTSIENDKDTKGAILCGQPHYFSAGLDLIELFGYNQGQISQFFNAFGALYLQLVQFKKPFICAITGHAPAGGCVLAVAADNRYMAQGEKYVIGLNEVAVNIQISQNLTEIYAFWMGKGLASRYLLEGKLLSGKEARNAGLVDELVPLEEVIPRSKRQMDVYLGADQQIWQNTKAKIRKHLWDQLDTNSGNALKEAADLWWKPEIRSKMEAYVKSFSKRKN
ncbi:Enoyl-CoA hydratase/isomerase [Croceitalea dokdonensis DOKDO 023]|uniref:Enoyl-CoA hydratase/isomerase n=1 Tax=Croceitalea dokdonensis DOKDO 023 TaxID=1300341 RepID=A0A0P7ADW6_9FLAO|nr:enoyl-CoA hydratase/isomerase family protein [Croceitalea dokdonensis]KPM31401.1 Enoyl-CoA hydratase/isomerase [Croceitalea dokdonensis DOKDO 023]